MNARFACMDTTNVNSGEKGELKAFLEFLVPHLYWIGCGSHRLAICFKHLVPLFSSVKETDCFLLNRWKCFHYRSLAENLLKEFAAI